MFKSIESSPELQQYLFKTGIHEHPLQKELREFTEKNLGNAATMQISPDQGALLQFIIKSSNIQNCLEIGTFTGYSALTMALALPENGSIVSLDIDKNNTDIAKKIREGKVGGLFNIKSVAKIKEEKQKDPNETENDKHNMLISLANQKDNEITLMETFLNR